MKLYIEEINTPCLGDEEYRYLEMRSEGRKYYNIYRGIKNNKGVLAAVEVDGKTMKEIGEPFEITYDQGRGFEPIDPDNNKLQKTVGKALGLRRESINESPDEEDYGIDEGVEIEVKNKGILEVPEGKNVDDLPMSHFEKLVKKNGLAKITKALNNLQVWNKNDDKKLSKWAGDMIDKLTKKYGKNESLKEDTYKSYWKYDVESDVFNRNEDSDTYLTKYDIRKVKLIPCKTPEECYDDERYWAVCKYEYPYDEFYGTKQEAYDMLLTSWNNSKYERIHDI